MGGEHASRACLGAKLRHQILRRAVAAASRVTLIGRDNLTDEIFVQRLIVATHNEKRIEKRVIQQEA